MKQIRSRGTMWREDYLHKPALVRIISHPQGLEVEPRNTRLALLVVSVGYVHFQTDSEVSQNVTMMNNSELGQSLANK